MISTHAPHARRGGSAPTLSLGNGDFYSRASCEARRCKEALLKALSYYFYSRASCEARLEAAIDEAETEDFYSRASCEARPSIIATIQRSDDFYSRASCEARRRAQCYINPASNISTHAPHARRGSGGSADHIGIVEFLLTRLMRGAAI